MNKIEFSSFVETLTTFFGAKAPGMKAVDLWFDMVQNIPAEALPWIETKICQDQETIPRNLPKAIRELFEAWLQAHPEKRARKESVDCPDCEGGWLCLTRPVRGYKVPPTFSAPCGRCRQVRAAQYMTLAEALRQGYSRVNLHAVTTVRSRNIGELIRSIGREIPGSDEPARLEELNRQASLLRETEEVTNHAEA